MGCSTFARLGAGAAMLGSLSLASSALADGTPVLDLRLNQDNWVDTTAQNDGSGGYVYADALSGADGLLEYRVTVLPSGASVLGFSFDITNTSTTTQFYTLTSAIAVSSMPDGCLLGASIGGSVTDANFDGVGSLTSVFGNSLFWGGIDFGAPWQQQLTSLINAPFNISVPYAGGTSSVGPESIGLPGPSASGAAFAAGYQSVALRFALTAGDRASFTGVFVLQAVPAPAALATFALGGVLPRRRRR